MDMLLHGIEALGFLKQEGFFVLKSKLATSEDEALACAKDIGFPITLKVLSKKALHKTEIGGVKTGIINEDGLRRGFNELVESCALSIGKAHLEGIIVQELGRGFEFIVGIYEDRQFGRVIMFGQGGIFVEALGNVTFRLLPINKRDARSMIEDLYISKALFSSRNRWADTKVIEDFLFEISDLLGRKPEIKEMDLNPVFVSNSAKICDARIKLSR